MYPARSGSVVARSAMDGSWAVTSTAFCSQPIRFFSSRRIVPGVTHQWFGHQSSSGGANIGLLYVRRTQLRVGGQHTSLHQYDRTLRHRRSKNLPSSGIIQTPIATMTPANSAVFTRMDDDEDIVDDHRGNLDTDFCSPLPCDVTKPRGTPVQVSLKAIQHLAGKPPMAPRHVKTSVSDQQRRQSSSVHNKVQTMVRTHR